jgi:cyclic dehypoxanthinyl futalosine synthase
MSSYYWSRAVLDNIISKLGTDEPISRQEGLFLLQETTLATLAPLAQLVRFRHNPEPVVTFAIDTNPNYTNICDVHCAFCAFNRKETDPDAYANTVEQAMEKIERATACGATTILLQGGLNPNLAFDYYIDLVKTTRHRFPQVHPHFFSAPEIQKMSKVSGLSLSDVLQKLKDAGLRTIPGGGAEILSDKVRQQLSPKFPKAKSADWIEVHRQAHKLGYRTTATMMYGHVEDDEDIIEHLDQIRMLQAETGGFTAFIPWSYKRESNPLGKRMKAEAGPNRYLRIIAVSRIFLNNFQHIQASWFSEGKKTGQVALRFGADDFGGTILEEDVMQCAGFYNRATVDNVVSLIQDAGFTPVQRTTLYEVLYYFSPTMSSTGTA